ncbi:MAG: lycopene cyclase domain-containing protein [Aggregatilineales bacterium]
MKYFGFLARYVVVPLAVLGFLSWRDARRGKKLPAELTGVPSEAVLGGLVAVAVGYTTPWDNYLVATRVWWYDPKLVNGLVLGYVPIEEYTFFVLQTLLTGAWTLYLARHLPADEAPPANPLRIRLGMTLALAAIWLAAVWNLFKGPRSRTYLSLTLSWALIPIMLQTAFGGDILWQHRRLVALGIIPATLYLGYADSLAIGSGTWTINPEKTVNIDLFGRLPLEEGVFFLLTNTLVTLGTILVLSRQSQQRVPPFVRRLLRLERAPASAAGAG